MVIRLIATREMCFGLAQILALRRNRIAYAGGLNALHDLSLGKHGCGVLGALEDALHQFGAVGNAAALQPEVYVRLAAHGTDLDDLLHSEIMRRHAGVDAVGQHDVVLVISLDDRRCMHPSASAERVAAY